MTTPRPRHARATGPAARALALCLLCAKAVLAQSVETPSPNAPFHLGPVQLFPLVSLHDVGVDSNVYNNSEVAREDFTYTLAPRVKAVLPIGGVRVTSNAGLGFVYFQTLKNQQSLNGSLSGLLDISSGRWVRATRSWRSSGTPTATICSVARCERGSSTC